MRFITASIREPFYRFCRIRGRQGFPRTCEGRLMSKQNGQTEGNPSGKREIQKLRGKRPPGVVGRMKPRQLIELLERMEREHTLEEEERTWRELDRILREDPV